MLACSFCVEDCFFEQCVPGYVSAFGLGNEFWAGNPVARSLIFLVMPFLLACRLWWSLILRYWVGNRL